MHRCRPCCKLDRRRRNAHTFSLLINSLVDFQHRVDFKVSQRLGLKFYRSYSPMLFCNPLHVHFSTIKHLLLALVFNKRFAKFSLIFYWERWTFRSQWHMNSLFLIFMTETISITIIFLEHSLKVNICHKLWISYPYIFKLQCGRP